MLGSCATLFARTMRNGTGEASVDAQTPNRTRLEQSTDSHQQSVTDEVAP